VTPGIRPVENRPADDQKRTVDVAQAFANGADYIVVGRPIRQPATRAQPPSRFRRPSLRFFPTEACFTNYEGHLPSCSPGAGRCKNLFCNRLQEDVSVPGGSEAPGFEGDVVAPTRTHRPKHQVRYSDLPRLPL